MKNERRNEERSILNLMKFPPVRFRNMVEKGGKNCNIEGFPVLRLKNREFAAANQLC
jgi:hypothetical protein